MHLNIDLKLVLASVAIVLIFCSPYVYFFFRGKNLILRTKRLLEKKKPKLHISLGSRRVIQMVVCEPIPRFYFLRKNFEDIDRFIQRGKMFKSKRMIATLESLKEDLEKEMKADLLYRSSA